MTSEPHRSSVLAHWRYRFAIAAIAAVVVVLVVWAAKAIARGANEALDARRERIANMSAAEKEQLRIKKERFAKLDESERQKLRTLHAAIESHSRRDQLHRVMLRYRQWLRELTPEDRAGLLTTPVSARLALVQKLQEKQHERYLAEAGKQMSPDDIKATKAWMDAIVAQRITAALEAADEWQERGLKKAIHDENAGMKRGIVWDMMFRGKVPPVTKEDRERLAASLSQKQRETWDDIAKTDEQRERVSNAWIMAALFSRRGWGGPGPSHEDLEKELAKLPPDVRKRISTLPPEQMREELKRKWFESQMSRRPGRGPGDRGPGDRGPGDRGPPGPPFGPDAGDHRGNDGDRRGEGRRGPRDDERDKRDRDENRDVDRNRGKKKNESGGD
jgi:hypothetical protein